MSTGNLSKILLFIFIACSLPALALAAPKWVRTSFTGDTAHSQTVSWNDGPADSTVEYGPDTNYGMTASGTSADAGGAIGVVHEVTLTGLTPDTAYHYRAGGTGDWSADHLLRTAPADVCTPLTFGVAADNRPDFSWLPSGCWKQVYEKVADEGVAFVINSGDLVLDGAEDGQWSDFLDDSEPFMGDVPLITCLGNHDDGPGQGDGANYNKIWALPRNQITNTEDYYSFDYGNIHFAALSTETFKDDGSYKYQKQHDWLVDDLSNTDRMWKIVYFHRPIYSIGGHGGNEDGQNPVFIPVFDQFHVDLVLTGHDHLYQHDGPRFNDQDVASTDDGTVYMVSGGGGAAVYPPFKHHYLVISVANNVMHIRAQIAGTSCLTLGSGGSGIMEEFDIVKTLADDPCQGGADDDNDGFSTPTDCCDSGSEQAPGCSVATAAGIHPGAAEICEDGIDQNCDGHDEACACVDADGDGYQSDACGGDDCDDADLAVNPGSLETCGDSIDNNCDGQTDENGCENCLDADGDGYYAEGADCPSGTDCDDGNKLVYPGAAEICNQIDDDCDTQTDEDDVCASDCTDADHDGHNAIDADCPAGDDCDDADADSYPGATEICGDDIDQDCSGQDLQCGCQDTDSDGFSSATCGGGDCDDTDAAVHPGADEACNAMDDDCDGQTDEDLGRLSCGIGACATSVEACLGGQPQSCEPLSRPESSETSCTDSIDNDCDGYVDADDSDCGAGDSGCGCGTDSPATQTPGGLLLLLALFLLRRRS